MNGKERVLNILNGKRVDRLPFGFWYHFPPESYKSVDETVKHHLAYQRATSSDVFKIMNENIFPYDVPIKTAADFLKIKPVKRDAPWIVKQKETTERIVRELNDQSFKLMTLHGIIASTWHARGGAEGYGEESLLLQAFLRDNPEGMLHIFKIIADAMCYLVDAVKDSGIDGIYYSALGGEQYLFTDEEYEQYIKPYDEQIFNYIMKVFPNSVLHLCKDQINPQRFKSLKPAIVNWGENQDNPPLEEIHKVWPEAVILGGFDNTKGPLIDGSEENIREHLRHLIKRFEGENFILGADCTLPMDIDWEQIIKVRKVLDEGV